ncbi:MAG: tyrosine-type recombinase/integrase [Pseudonocardiaceae bacterium]
MRVQRVLMPGSGAESWTLLGEDHVPVEPVERFLAFLASIERSPNTLKAYAHDLKDWFAFLNRHGLDWRAVTLEDVAGYVAWLRLPPAARDGRVVVLPRVEHHCAVSSVNRKLAALTSFCEFHARHGERLGGLLVTMGPAGRRGSVVGSYRPFLQHVVKGEPRRRTLSLAAPAARPQVLTVAQVQAVLDGCVHLRDRLLFALLLDTGVRVGEALGLRHEDVEIAERQVTIMPRDNDNRARAKGGRSRTIPASSELMRLYADYLHREYGALDSDYVFVNVWAEPRGHLLAYPAVYDLVRRLRRRTGVAFGPHLFRHTYATWLLRRGAGMESVKELLGHASITTTIDTYGHLTVEDARRTLQAAGWFTGREVRL